MRLRLASPLVVCLIGLLAPLLDARAGELPTALLSDDTVGVVRLDLARLDPASLTRLIPDLADAPGVSPDPLPVAAVRLLDSLKAAGITEAFLLLSAGDLPGPPLLAVRSPRTDAARVKARDAALAAVRSALPAGSSPVAGRVIRGWPVIGVPSALDRLDATPSTDRLDLARALDLTVEDANSPVIRAAIAPGSTLRRALAEAVPELPAALGGGSTRPLTEGLEWAALELKRGAEPKLVLELRARDVPPAPPSEAIVALLERARTAGAQALGANPLTRDAAPTLAGLAFTRAPGSVEIGAEVDAKAALSLVRAPLRLASASRQDREAIDQFKTIGLALHNYHSTHGTFPPAFQADATGRPLLSWRVLILPDLGEQALYNEFHLDEAWDSPHNKALIPRMPMVYASPFQAANLTTEGRTTTLAPRGPDTMIRNAKGVAIQQITDGTVGTVALVQGADKDAVVWTKPDDSTADTPPDLGGRHPLILLAEGSVRRIRPDIKLDVFRALLTTTGGEVFDPNNL